MCYPSLIDITNEDYDEELHISDFILDHDSKDYQACQYSLNGSIIIHRCSKITPKKPGQFVTIWKRDSQGNTRPYHAYDPLDYLVIHAWKDDLLGEFVFHKQVLLREGIISQENRLGKRGFRLYPSWDKVDSKQARKTQEWQLEHFRIVNT